jgi:hypothetical protein
MKEKTQTRIWLGTLMLTEGVVQVFSHPLADSQLFKFFQLQTLTLLSAIW